MRIRTLAPGALFLVAAFTAVAQNAPVHVLASNGVKAVIEELQPQAERAIGRPLAIEFDTSSSVKKRIESGEAFDVAILTSDVIGDLARAGKIAAGSRTEIARCGIGIGVRSGAAKPDIHSSDALKKTLLAAKSITYAQDGASRVHILEMEDKLGIADKMKAKTILEQGSVRSNARVADGSAEMVLTLVSEILPAKGVQLVGPLPAEVQHYVDFATGISPNSKNTDAGKALAKFFASPAVAPTLKVKGMESPR
ncbi:MAG: molybdenum transporter substrate-binding protein [Bryobacterales bacterium]|jgi:molybdate transport system substrate-binding protein|nr:molybdenum transporter substrate-binding protein [Bryobacterales bacterium]